MSIKQFFLFCFLFFAGILCVALYKHALLLQMSTELKTPLSNIVPFSLATPPKDSLKGSIVSFSADTKWQARSASIPADLVEKIPVLQGQDFWTHERGTIRIAFPNTIQITLLANSHISFIQTLPSHFVILQDSGNVSYKNSGRLPISVTAWPLLIQQNRGEMEIAVDTENALTVLTVKKGTVTLGFNDAENISRVLKIQEGELYTFDSGIREGEISLINE